MPFSFANSFAGYTFSFSLLKNFFQNEDDALNASLNSILNVPLVNSSPFSLPFINQLLLQPFGNTKAAYDTNSKTKTDMLVPDSSFNAKGLSLYFAAAFTPGNINFQYKKTRNGTADSFSYSASVMLNYNYQCTNTVYGGTCVNLPTVTFTFTGDNAKTLAMSDSQYLHVPYWTDEQLSSSDASGCYPTVDRIQVHLESDPDQQNWFDRVVGLITDDKTNNTLYTPYDPATFNSFNPDLYDSSVQNPFPVLYFRVVLDNLTEGKLPSNNLRRPFVLSNVQSTGQEIRVIQLLNSSYNPSFSGQSLSTLSPVTALISQIAVQSTKTIGLLVLPKLEYSLDVNQQTINAGQSNNVQIYIPVRVDIELGSFPTASGAVIASNTVNTIRNGDVVNIQAKNGWTFGTFTTQNDGNYMGFEQLNKNQTKIPSMNTTPQNRFQPNTDNHYSWQIVTLSLDGKVVGQPGDPIKIGEYVGFYTFRCNSSTDSYVKCGWLSATGCGDNCSPTVAAVSNVCEVWTIDQDFQPSTGPTVQNGSFITIKASEKNTCGFRLQYLTNANRSGTNPPTMYSSYDQQSIWKLTRIYNNSFPLPG